jgi:hypothetical protein
MLPSFTLIGRHAFIFEKGKILSNDYSGRRNESVRGVQVDIDMATAAMEAICTSEMLIHASTCF